MMPIDFICYDLLNNCILVGILLHSDLACMAIEDERYHRLREAIWLGIPQFDVKSLYDNAEPVSMSYVLTIGLISNR